MMGNVGRCCCAGKSTGVLPPATGWFRRELGIAVEIAIMVHAASLIFEPAPFRRGWLRNT
ncbi:hypothetical protein KCP71_17605 [Salmonella enterica subsp. enterica]|nr:hypothetical protein KCP71_17605 [Salmonella enterica subsp. enterica]